MPVAATWPPDAAALAALQNELGRAAPPPWTPWGASLAVAGCFVAFPRHVEGRGRAGDPTWAGAALVADGRVVATSVWTGTAGAPYEATLLALREGLALEGALRGLDGGADVVLVDATGRDHPRRAGLALHLGAVLDVPTVGVTHRPLRADGPPPGPAVGDRAPLELDGELVGYWLRTAPGARPVAVHAAWRTDADTAADVVAGVSGRRRTPEPLAAARAAARTARAVATGAAPAPPARRQETRRQSSDANAFAVGPMRSMPPSTAHEAPVT